MTVDFRQLESTVFLTNAACEIFVKTGILSRKDWTFGQGLCYTSYNTN